MYKCNDCKNEILFDNTLSCIYSKKLSKKIYLCEECFVIWKNSIDWEIKRNCKVCNKNIKEDKWFRYGEFFCSLEHIENYVV